jgi:hypothetical protein
MLVLEIANNTHSGAEHISWMMHFSISSLFIYCMPWGWIDSLSINYRDLALDVFDDTDTDIDLIR